MLFVSRESWINHIVDEHGGATVLSCLFCEEACAFQTDQEFDEHLISCHGFSNNNEHIWAVRESCYKLEAIFPDVTACPLCGVTITELKRNEEHTDSSEHVNIERMLDHVGKCIQGFSLYVLHLPWRSQEVDEDQDGSCPSQSTGTSLLILKAQSHVASNGYYEVNGAKTKEDDKHKVRRTEEEKEWKEQHIDRWVRNYCDAMNGLDITEIKRYTEEDPSPPPSGEVWSPEEPDEPQYQHEDVGPGCKERSEDDSLGVCGIPTTSNKQPAVLHLPHSDSIWSIRVQHVFGRKSNAAWHRNNNAAGT
ncbi:hypothetical protein VTJ04DRAFT_7905 [Mycothermus thermophilus]|uniref:uncharacterized protein n=1 Tax=Humicola insolens TaxID=85995 RepID=UPI003742364F